MGEVAHTVAPEGCRPQPHPVDELFLSFILSCFAPKKLSFVMFLLRPTKQQPIIRGAKSAAAATVSAGGVD